MVERVSYKRGATDFSSQVARLKAAGCDFVAVGTLIRETIGAKLALHGFRTGWQARRRDSESDREASAVDAMKHGLKTKAGRAAYALRKQTVEPVFGIIKSVMGFRQFLLRGLENVRNEWTLVCLAWNLKRMAVLRPQ